MGSFHVLTSKDSHATLYIPPASLALTRGFKFRLPSGLSIQQVVQVKAVGPMPELRSDRESEPTLGTAVQ